jgi:peptidoglycan/LPS O-acetylase OafA/YrhL
MIVERAKMISRVLRLIERTLSRKTSSGEFLPEVDGLRFIAIFAVLLHHTMARYLTVSNRFGHVDLPATWYLITPKHWLVNVAFLGYFGVRLFFVISGFILALPFARAYFNDAPQPSLKQYYFRRLVRIEPPYIISLIACFAVIWFTNLGRHVFIPHFFASLFYAHGSIFGQASWVNGVAWSLEVEIQFYLLVPILVRVFAIDNMLVRRVVLIIAMVVLGVIDQRYIESSDLNRLKLSLLPFLQYFLAGFLLADVFLKKRVEVQADGRRRGSPYYDALAVLAAASVVRILVAYPDLFFLLPFAVGAFYLAVFRGQMVRAIVTWKPLVIIGGMCYTIYLYHFLIIDQLGPHIYPLISLSRPFWMDFGIQFGLWIGAILSICALLFACIERPFMSLWLRSRTRNTEAIPPIQVAAPTFPE